MPSIAAHMVVAKLVSDSLSITNPLFIKGNLLPDIIKKENSHYRIQGKYFQIPDIDYFKSHYNLSNNLYLGYYVHLLLDKYFLDEFIIKRKLNLNAFTTKIMYNDYSLINFKLVKEFNLNIDYLMKILKSDYEVEINQKKLDYNLKCLSNTSIGKTTYLDIEDFSKFLSDISLTISKEIESYASKSN